MHLLSSACHIFQNTLRIDDITGEITLSTPLDREMISKVILTVTAEDLNGLTEQKATGWLFLVHSLARRVSKIKQRNITNVLLLNMQFEMCCIMSLDNVQAKYFLKILIV